MSGGARGEFQVRWRDGAIRWYRDFQKAWDAFFDDPRAWKLSFTAGNGKRMRLLRTEVPGHLRCEYMEDAIKAGLDEMGL